MRPGDRDRCAGPRFAADALTRAQVRNGARRRYLQYTSGSTRQPGCVVVTHQNVIANIRAEYRRTTSNESGECRHGLSRWSLGCPSTTTWDCYSEFTGAAGRCLDVRSVLMSPMAFSAEAGPVDATAGRPTAHSFSAAPNFAFELAARRTSDDDMAGLDLGDVHTVSAVVNGYTPRRSGVSPNGSRRFNLPDTALRPSYGLAEATLYVMSSPAGAAHRRPCGSTTRSCRPATRSGATREAGAELVSVGPPRASTVRIVDPETRMENPAGKVGRDLGARRQRRKRLLAKPAADGADLRRRARRSVARHAAGTVASDRGSGRHLDGELFIVGRIKDLLIVDGRNHYPDDIEATIQEITGGRVAAISDSR